MVVQGFELRSLSVCQSDSSDMIHSDYDDDMIDVKPRNLIVVDINALCAAHTRQEPAPCKSSVS